MLSYNEGLYYGPPTLTAALWRNLYFGGEVNAVQLEITHAYIMKKLVDIDEMKFMDGFKF